MTERDEMNDKLQETLPALIEKSLKAFDAGADFMAGEIPEVIQQLLLWHMTLSGVKMVFALLLIIFIIIGNWHQYKWWTTAIEYRNSSGDKRVMTRFEHNSVPASANMLQILFVLPITWGMNLTWLKIWIAPKVFLIEYAAHVLK